MEIGRWVSQASWVEKTIVAFYAFSAGFLIYGVVLAVTTPFYLREVARSANIEVAGSIRNLPSISELSVYQEIVDQHPVFGVVRQQQAVVAVSACDQFQAKYVLAGIVGGATDAQNEALFNSKIGKQTQIVRVGDSVDGITVEQVGSDKVLISCSGKQAEITMGEL